MLLLTCSSVIQTCPRSNLCAALWGIRRACPCPPGTLAQKGHSDPSLELKGHLQRSLGRAGGTGEGREGPATFWLALIYNSCTILIYSTSEALCLCLYCSWVERAKLGIQNLLNKPLFRTDWTARPHRLAQVCFEGGASIAEIVPCS